MALLLTLFRNLGPLVLKNDCILKGGIDLRFLHGFALIVMEGAQCRVTLPEQDGFQHGPRTGKVPVFAEHVSRIALTTDVMKANNPGGNSKSCPVKRQGIVTLGELAVGNRGGVNDSLVVPKHERRSDDLDS